MKWYRILSLKHSPVGNDCVWWRPDCKGYSAKLEDAGLYSQEEIDRNPAYYSNGRDTKAIEADHALSLSHTAVSWPIS